MGAESSPSGKGGVGRWAGRAAAITILIVSAGGAYWLGTRGQGWAAANGGLEISGYYLNFGEVWESKAFRWDLPLENPTDKEVKVLQFFSSCTCQKVTPETLLVSPGGRGKVTLTLDLTHSEAGVGSSPVRDFVVQLVPLVEGLPVQQSGWEIRGRVRVALTASLRKVDFGTKLSRGLPFPSQTVKLAAHTPIAVVAAETNPLISAHIRRLASDPGQYQLTITPQQKLPLGEFKFNILVKSRGPEGVVLPELVIPVVGFVVEDVQAVPGSLLFGMKPVGGTVTDTVVLQAASGKAFEVVSIECGSEDVTVAPAAASPQGTRDFQVTQRITKRGDQLTSVRFSIRTLGGPQGTVLGLPVGYHGVSEQVRPTLTKEGNETGSLLKKR